MIDHEAPKSLFVLDSFKLEGQNKKKLKKNIKSIPFTLQNKYSISTELQPVKSTVKMTPKLDLVRNK